MTITCPHCWQTIEIEDPPFDDQPIDFTTDCEVCCRPIAITVTYRSPDTPPEITISPES